MHDRITGGDPKVKAWFRDYYPAGRIATPEEVAKAAVWLCSDAASYMSGHKLTMDGGRTIR